MARIIIADDSKGVVLYLSEIVKKLGHEPIQCSNGKEAVVSFIEQRADLLILDNMMPSMSGLDVCRSIRKMPDGVHIPIIIVSGYISEENIMEGLNAGASDYLAKPIAETHLVAKIKTYLRTHSLCGNDFDIVRRQGLILKRYQIKRFLGYGPHSVVFLAEDQAMENRLVAVKLLHENEIVKEISKTFIDTARQFTKLESGDILKIYDYGDFSGRPFLVQEFAPDGDLAGILKRRPLNQAEAIRLAIEISRALKYLHAANILHLDVKPENIMIFKDRQKLGDFGVSSIARKVGYVPVEQNIWGSLLYSPPEVIDRAKEISGKSDIYSLGVVLYEALTGGNPFESEMFGITMSRQVSFNPPPIIEHHAGFSKGFSDLIQKMMHKKSEKRPYAVEVEKSLLLIKKEISEDKEEKIETDMSKVREAIATQIFMVKKLPVPKKKSFLEKLKDRLFPISQ